MIGGQESHSQNVALSASVMIGANHLLKGKINESNRPYNLDISSVFNNQHDSGGCLR
jgi:hypothetical protein